MWNPEKYLQFANQRTQPVRDLVQRVPLVAPQQIIDIGCGPGNSTAVLAQRFPTAKILGIDSSQQMIAVARKNNPNIEFAIADANGDLSKWHQQFDLVLSNACIQWIANHRQLLPRLMQLVKPGGMLAIQIPNQFDQPVHKLIDKTAKSPTWTRYFPNPRVFHNLPPIEYYELMSQLSKQVAIWESIYWIPMSGADEIIDWYRSTGLLPYLEQLTEPQKVEFEQQILQQITVAYPTCSTGQVIFKMPRIFFTAVKAI